MLRIASSHSSIAARATVEPESLWWQPMAAAVCGLHQDAQSRPALGPAATVNTIANCGYSEHEGRSEAQRARIVPVG